MGYKGSSKTRKRLRRRSRPAGIVISIRDVKHQLYLHRNGYEEQRRPGLQADVWATKENGYY